MSPQRAKGVLFAKSLLPPFAAEFGQACAKSAVFFPSLGTKWMWRRAYAPGAALCTLHFQKAMPYSRLLVLALLGASTA